MQIRDIRGSLPRLATLIALLSAMLPARAGDTPLTDPRVGKTDSQGRLIIHVYAGVPAPLTTAYGIAMGHARDNVYFTLAMRDRKSVREFTSYPDFLQALAELPKGSTVTIYDRCTVPRFYDFYPVHGELYEKFVRDCRRRGLKVSNEPKVTCTCAAYERPELGKLDKGLAPGD